MMSTVIYWKVKYAADSHIKPDYAFGDPIRFLTVRF